VLNFLPLFDVLKLKVASSTRTRFFDFLEKSKPSIIREPLQPTDTVGNLVTYYKVVQFAGEGTFIHHYLSYNFTKKICKRDICTFCTLFEKQHLRTLFKVSPILCGKYITESVRKVMRLGKLKKIYLT